MSDYGNHTYTDTARQLQYYKIISFIQTNWPFQLKFEIKIFGVPILHMEQKKKNYTDS